MNDSFLQNGQPDLTAINQAFIRCAPPMPGGLDWLDQVRTCNGPGDSFDGRKHKTKDDPNSKAFPWENASNCKPYTADDVINELTARNLVAFWRSMVQRGAGTSDEADFAVALVEHWVFGPMLAKLDKEVELSAQLMLARGWCVLAPRWKIEFGRKRYELKLADIQAQQDAAAQQLLAIQKLPPEQQAQLSGDQLAQLSKQAQLVSIILDPTLTADAKDFLRQWYDTYVRAQVPEPYWPRIPKANDKQLNRVLAGLRSQEQRAIVGIPYLCRNELEISALEPWREVCLPNEVTDAQEVIFQLEYVSPTTLQGRVLSDGYTQAWVDEVVKKKQTVFNWSQLPVRAQPLGPDKLLAGGPNPTPNQPPMPDNENGMICIVHAVYKALDEDDIPAAYCTVFHPDVKELKGEPLFGKHELVEEINGELPYVDLVYEWRNRAITSSRSVIEMVATDQKLIKDTFDQIVDRGSITIMPPINTYESPTGASYSINGPAIGDLEFGPGSQNRFRRKETAAEFMSPPSGQGMADGVEVYRAVQKKVDNRFGLMSEDVPPARIQTLQEKAVRRFLIAWTRAFIHGLALYQEHGDDKEFARITGAPDGWLDERRKTPGALSALFDFDVRELDSETFAAIVTAMDTSVIPMDTMNVIDRSKYIAWKSRGFCGPRTARQFLRPLPDASQALQEKAENQVLKMYAGIPPMLIDKDDPTASGLLDFTKQTVLGNPKFVAALTPEALSAVAGEQLPLILAQIRQAGIEPRPDPLFSQLLLEWLKNLTFIGVTQQRNKQIGRQGVDGGQANG